MFIFQKQLAQQKQLEEVNAAGAIRTLRDAVKSAVALQRDDLVAYPEGVTLQDASAFLPQEYFSGFRVAVRREGAKLSAIIVSPTSLGRYALDNLSAARISSMLGASGGFVPSLTDEPSSTASGTLGLWTLDMNSIDAGLATPVRIVVNIALSEAIDEFSEEKEKLLYRTSEYGQSSNTMLTSLFFSDGSSDTIILDPAAGSVTGKSAEFSGAITAGGQVRGQAFSNSGGTWAVDASGNMGNANYTVGANGAVTFKAISGTTGTFSGAVSTGALTSTTGTFSGALKSSAGVSGTTGTFSAGVSGTTGTFTGAVKGTTGTFSAGVSGTTGTFSGAVKGTTGTFSSGVSGTTGSFSGNLTSSGTVRSTKTSSVGAACNAGEIASDGDGTTLACVKKKWSVWNRCTFTDQIFTADGTWTAPCTGNFEITAVGGGGGGTSHDGACNLGGVRFSTGGGGGGSSSFNGSIIAGGGGGAGEQQGTTCGGNSGEVETATTALTKGTSYTIYIGKGGAAGNGRNASGGNGYSKGNSSSGSGNCDCQGCIGGNGANYKNSSVRAPANDSWRRGLGGNVAGACGFNGGGAGFNLNGVPYYGQGGNAGAAGFDGAVYVKLVK
ncbi:hypothetical protein FACS1894186_3450 [Alphaproteobacteria bacterium]|nr:hypothetical protein FACS1894186_3450 [Alphaproteobacteria bacterium]